MVLIVTALAFGVPSATNTVEAAPPGYALAASFDFSAGSLDGLETRPTSEWTVTDGTLTITKVGSEGAVRGPFSYAVLPGYWVGDLIMTFRARCHADPAVQGRDVCALVGWSDHTHFTYLHFSNLSDGLHNSVLKVDATDRVPLESHLSPRPGLSDDRWHTFRIERSLADGLVRGYMDDMETPCLLARDPEPWAGRVGVGSFDDRASFDDIRLYVKHDRPALDDVLAPGASVERVATGFAFTEGPSWDARQRLLKFSDLPANRIYTLAPAGEVGIFIDPSEQSNGTFYDPRDGSLLACRHWARDVVRFTAQGSVTVLAGFYQGGRFNSPNDCVLTPWGAIYFTDPTYGLGDRPAEQQVEAVYCIEPGGAVVRVIDDMAKPNGIYISPDGAWLYVADSVDLTVRAYRVQEDGTCAGGRVLGELKAPEEGVPDGMTLDSEGRIYCAGSGGIWVFSPQGELVGRIPVPEPPANCTFGGDELSTLYITARTSVYRIETRVTGFVPPLL